MKGMYLYMKRRTTKVALSLLATTLLSSNIVGLAQEVNPEGMPIVDETLQVDYFVGKGAMNAPHDWNDIFIWNTYEDMTNIDINWAQQVSTDALEEQKNLALVSGNIPDVFYLSSFSNSDIFRYGQQDIFIPLNDLIEEYAPNLNALMEADPTIKKAITFPDGNIYSMPSIIDEDFISVRIASRPWINSEILEELNMEIPETTEEFYNFLVAVKENNPDVIPYGGTSMNELFQYLAGSYGLMNRGVRNGAVDYDEENDSIRFFPVTEEYKELLQFVNKLYTEGLIDESIFTIEWGQFLANAGEDQYASYVFYDPSELFGDEVGVKYGSMSALEGPHGDQLYIKVAPSVNTIGNFLLTSEHPNPAASVRWMDYFYSDEGAQFYYMGVEGETFEMVDGQPQYVDRILNPTEGTFEQELSKQLTWIGATQSVIKEEYFRGSEGAPQSLEAAEKIAPHIPEEIWPSFTYTEEETEFLLGPGADIDRYITESRDLFITGQLSFDDWDSYVKNIEQMGLEKYLSVKEIAYSRYLEE